MVGICGFQSFTINFTDATCGLISSHFFNFPFKQFCVDWGGEHLFATDSFNVIYKFKLNGKINNNTQIMKQMTTFNMCDFFGRTAAIDKMFADNLGGLVMSIESKIYRFSNVDNTLIKVCNFPAHFCGTSFSSNGNVVIWSHKHIVCYE